MKLFMHAHLSRIDLSGYGNTTQQYLETIAHLSNTLTALSLRHCSKIVDFSPLSACRQLEVLDVSDTKLTSKQLFVLLEPLKHLAVLKIARTKVSQLPLWLPLSLEELDVQQTQLDDGLVTAVRRLTNLRHLNVADTGMCVALFCSLKQLITLNCSGCTLLRSESLFWIAGCTSLMSLDLSRAVAVRGSALFQLRKLTRLENLVLPPSSSCAPNDFSHLASLRRLTALSLARYNVKDLSFCAGMEDVSFLDLAACPVNNLDALSHMTSLTQLNLQDCLSVTDVSLLPLAHLPLLRTLNLSHTRVSDSGMKIVGECQTLCSLTLNQVICLRLFVFSCKKYL
jgi:Leucine-rich repeat (LRR) protein